jgi:hypothetical protein
MMWAGITYPQNMYFMLSVQITHKNGQSRQQRMRICGIERQTYRIFTLLETCYWPYEVVTSEVVHFCAVHIVIRFQCCHGEVTFRIPIVVQFDG